MASGHIRKRGSVWYVVLSLGHSPETGQRLRKWHRAGPRKKDAERLRIALLHQVQSGGYHEPTKQTVAEFLEKWLVEQAKPNVAPQTYARYSTIVRRRLIPTLGKMCLSDLRPMHVTEAVRSWQEEGLASRTVLYHYRILSQALKRAVRWGLLPRNPVDAVDPPKVRSRPIAALTKAQVRELLARATDTGIESVLHAAIYTGMRQGELLGLRWQDLNLEDGVIQVRQTLNWVSGDGFSFREPKSRSGRRSIWLSPGTIDILKRHRAQQAENRLKLGGGYQDRDLVFALPNGGPTDPNNLRKRFKGVARAAGVPHCRFHDLRHTHASLMLEKGVHPKVVQERLGHASIALTLDTYSHVVPSLQQALAERIDQWFDDGRTREENPA